MGRGEAAFRTARRRLCVRISVSFMHELASGLVASVTHVCASGVDALTLLPASPRKKREEKETHTHTSQISRSTSHIIVARKDNRNTDSAEVSVQA